MRQAREHYWGCTARDHRSANFFSRSVLCQPAAALLPLHCSACSNCKGRGYGRRKLGSALTVFGLTLGNGPLSMVFLSQAAKLHHVQDITLSLHACMCMRCYTYRSAAVFVLLEGIDREQLFLHAKLTMAASIFAAQTCVFLYLKSECSYMASRYWSLLSHMQPQHALHGCGQNP